MAGHRVAVFGGGVAGLTVAHELARVGGDAVEVTVYERNQDLGGKARSFAKPGTAGEGGGRALPGEHGFRFFPGYYKHVVQTMRDIPYPAGGPGATTADNLVAAPETHFARTSGEALEMPNHFPSNLDELADIFTFGGDVGISFPEARRFAKAMLAMFCSCDDRRIEEFEKISWYDFVEGGACGADYRKYLADGLNQRTVAASGHDVSARTVGLTLVRIMTDWLRVGNVIDRVLDGPTSERWIEPWRAHLVGLGVRFVPETALVELQRSSGGLVTAAAVEGPAGPAEVDADSYVLAIPLADAQVVAKRSGLVGADVGLDRIMELSDDWMNGIQLYLDGVLDLAAGHTIYVDSSLSLTSISQRQFWPGVEFGTLGHGDVEAILSVDISDWDTECGCCQARAKDMTREQVKDHVVAQLEEHLEASYGVSLPTVVDWFLDPAIVEVDDPKARPRLENREGLFINRTDSWSARPTATTGIGNLFLASDYVQTTTDLATMEGANEAGRRAARGVLLRAGWSPPAVEAIELFEFDEPKGFVPARLKDEAWYHVMGSPAPPVDGAPAPPPPGPPPMPDLPEEWDATPQP